MSLPILTIYLTICRVGCLLTFGAPIMKKIFLWGLEDEVGKLRKKSLGRSLGKFVHYGKFIIPIYILNMQGMKFMNKIT